MEDLKRAIKQMRNGEEKGFNDVYSKTYNRVYFRAKQIMKNEEDAEDLTQIVFVEAYKNIHTLQSVEAIYSWLDGITYRQGMKLYRKKKDVLLTEEAQIMFDELESNDIDSMPELTADQKATADIIRGIIEELPELQKTAVIAYYFDGLKIEQIADMMECSVNTIKSRLNYARKYIKDRVEEKEKKEGYRMHVFGFPVLWFAIKSMADGTTLTTQAAQTVYNEVCSNVGLQAAAIASSASGAAAAGKIASLAAKAKGIGAKFASLSMKVKSIIVAGTLAVAGTVGMAAFVHNPDKLDFEFTVEAVKPLFGELFGKSMLDWDFDELHAYLKSNTECQVADPEKEYCEWFRGDGFSGQYNPDEDGREVIRLWDAEYGMLIYRDSICIFLDESSNFENKKIFGPYNLGEDVRMMAGRMQQGIYDILMKQELSSFNIKFANGECFSSGHMTEDGREGIYFSNEEDKFELGIFYDSNTKKTTDILFYYY
ncbi:MAG: RNA polymerase sigma factor [Lachnospiraceae bacterium]|nr:RNA polymerase sigma factor [Lachnospiraceae bacterium]